MFEGTKLQFKWSQNSHFDVAEKFHIILYIYTSFNLWSYSLQSNTILYSIFIHNNNFKFTMQFLSFFSPIFLYNDFPSYFKVSEKLYKINLFTHKPYDNVN
jgi:hypothetical protein